MAKVNKKEKLVRTVCNLVIGIGSYSVEKSTRLGLYEPEIPEQLNGKVKKDIVV